MEPMRVVIRPLKGLELAIVGNSCGGGASAVSPVWALEAAGVTNRMDASSRTRCQTTPVFTEDIAGCMHLTAIWMQSRSTCKQSKINVCMHHVLIKLQKDPPGLPFSEESGGSENRRVVLLIMLGIEPPTEWSRTSLHRKGVAVRSYYHSATGRGVGWEGWKDPEL